jgi:hypothetical protein
VRVRDPMSVNWVLSPLLSLSCTVPENYSFQTKHRGSEQERERERAREREAPVYEDDKSLSDFLNKQV